MLTYFSEPLSYVKFNLNPDIFRMKEEKHLFCAITFYPFKSKLYERA